MTALPSTQTRWFAGILLIVTPLAFNLLFTLLSVTFEYPDILRQPAGYVLTEFDAGGASLIATWYGFMLTALLFVPLAVLVSRTLSSSNRESLVLGLATVFGILAGTVQFLGLIRQPLLVPSLANTYLDSNSSDASRDAVVVVFDAFNQYAGVAIGEQLGYIFTALWTALIAWYILGPIGMSTLSERSGPWLGFAGLLSAAGILIGTLEPAGVAIASDTVAFSYILWSLWLIALGIAVLRGPATRT